MEVISHSDHDTHSIMGGGKRHAATVNLNSGLITTLSTSLYSDNFLATVREVICNAWDAHKLTKIRHVPIEVELTNQTLVIKDFGPGIPHDKIGKIYLDYGGSTKVASEDETGGFGLGSKSPFSYTDFFNVENNHAGTKGIYTVSRGSSETDGMPDMIEIVKVPTTDTGLSVEIPIADPRDLGKFTQVIRDVITLGGINAKFNGTVLDMLDFEDTKEGIIFTDRKPYITNGLLYVRYGNVIYPIKEHRDYANQYEEATAIMQKTARQNSYGYYYSDSRKPLIAIFDAPSNSLSVVPSREDLHSSPRTINTVKGLLDKFIKGFHPLEGSKNVLEREQLILEDYVAKKKDIRPLLLDENIIMEYYKNNRDRFYSMTGDFKSCDELIVALAANGHFYDKNTLAKARENRLAMAIKHSERDKDLLRKLQKLLIQNPHIWGNNHFCSTPRLLRKLNPILSRAGAAGLNPKNFIHWDETQQKGRRQYGGQELFKTLDTMENLVRATKRQVMVTPFKGYIKSYKYQVRQPDGWERIPDDGCLVYVLPGTKKWASYEATIAFFTKMGYDIIDLMPFDIENRRLDAIINPPKAAPASKPKAKPKPKNQYLKLTNLLGDHGHFNYRRHLDVDRDTLHYTKGPVAVFVGDNVTRKGYYQRFFRFGDNYAGEIIKLYGKNVVIAKTQQERDKILTGGAVDGTEYLVQNLCKDILADEELKKFKEASQIFRNIAGITAIRYQLIRQYSRNRDRLPELPKEPKEGMRRWKILDYLAGRSHTSAFTPEQKKLLDETHETVIKWAATPSKNILEGVFAKDMEERLRRINLGVILDELEHPAGLSQRQKVFNETLLALTLFG